MSILRKLSHKLLRSSIKNIYLTSVDYFDNCGMLHHNLMRTGTVKLNTSQDFNKCEFHTSSNNRDIEQGLRCLGGGFAMIGSIGAGIGIGTIYGNLLAGVARNPSTKDQLFTLAIMGTVFCETISLFCFLVCMIVLFT